MSELNEVANRQADQIAGVGRVSLLPNSAQRIIDTSVAGTIYIGVSAPGTAQGAAKSWFLEKVLTSGTTITITHAVDSWTNRASAAYS